MTVMLSALIAKFAQNPPLIEQLLATGEQILEETSLDDPFWGHGGDGQGESYLLTTLRHLLRLWWPQAQLQNAVLDEQAMFSAVLSQHTDWWNFEQARAEAQAAALGGALCAMVRDTDLTVEQFNRYTPGAIFLEPAFLTGSTEIKAGLAASTRFVLLAPEIRTVSDFSPIPEAHPAICSPGGWWKVMGRFTVEGMGLSLITLLQVPESAAYLFDSIMFTSPEATIYEALRVDLVAALAQPPIAACQSPEWLEQVSGPIGFSADGQYQELWINGMVQPGNSVKESRVE